MKRSFDLIVQQDLTLLVYDKSPHYDNIRLSIQRFSMLVKHPVGIHTFRMSPITLWNAAAIGMKSDEVISALEQYASAPVPMKVKQDITLWMDRYGLFTLEGEEGSDILLLRCRDVHVLSRMMQDGEIGLLISGKLAEDCVIVQPKNRGRIKRDLARAGYPIIDRVGYREGERLSFSLADPADEGKGRTFSLRSYQQEAVQAFIGSETLPGGDGVVVLPCGAGKTVVGIGAIAALQSETLILTSNATSVKQWKAELLRKTTLREDQIGTYTSTEKEVRPITISTYQMMTFRRSDEDEWIHMRLFHERNWGLLIYDEVHLLPAPVFRTTADLQAARRLGLTATLVREDGCEKDVFSLIGPKRYEQPWKSLEKEGWIATVHCVEVRVDMEEETHERYLAASEREKARIAGENEQKELVVNRLLERHASAPTLIIGQYLNQLRTLSERLRIPLMTGETPQQERERLYQQFRSGELRSLIVSKVANFAVDLPDATIAIQVSGSFGSRQEEAQRIGRVLRPKSDGREAYFYSVVTDRSKEQEFARKRQLFLAEQGYTYDVMKGEGIYEVESVENDDA
ncbi:DNA repair helicase XPB [Paenibacillus sp. 1001270B_150601_E10]|uniref:DNA repair helicase XPB n=1 Tax=Paenibacillus sp. 1001270B_150601_E10 TaxID=2787079 RepID=UPI00189FEA40|nr:DNA repair helicase XPB [Paenibacillus sp. 1001270B_150601_E10]